MEDFYEENEDVFTAIGAFAAVKNADQQAKNASNQRRDNAALREELRKQKDLLAEQNISNEKRLKIEEEILELNRRAAEKDDEERAAQEAALTSSAQYLFEQAARKRLFFGTKNC